MAAEGSEVLAKIRPLLRRSEEDPRQVVVMTCGISGAGKSTLSKAIVAEFPRYERLSIDGLLHEKHGIYGRDYPAEKYEELSDEVEGEYDRRLAWLLEDGKWDIVLDRAFYDREDRVRFRKLIEDAGARPLLVYLRPASREQIWARIVQRRKNGVNADSAREISRELLDKFWDGFHVPEGEGEIVIDVK